MYFRKCSFIFQTIHSKKIVKLFEINQLVIAVLILCVHALTSKFNNINMFEFLFIIGLLVIVYWIFIYVALIFHSYEVEELFF